MARVAVDVVIKPEILDPQGKAILAALSRAGHPGIRSVRAGKHFDLEVDDSVTDEELTAVAGSVLANPVIEDWTIRRLPTNHTDETDDTDDTDATDQPAGEATR